MKLVLYANASESSSKARDFLKRLQLEFEEVDVNTKQGQERLHKRTQQQGVPALEITRSHGVGVIAGFDESNWKQQLAFAIGRK